MPAATGHGARSAPSRQTIHVNSFRYIQAQPMRNTSTACCPKLVANTKNTLATSSGRMNLESEDAFTSMRLAASTASSTASTASPARIQSSSSGWSVLASLNSCNSTTVAPKRAMPAKARKGRRALAPACGAVRVGGKRSCAARPRLQQRKGCGGQGGHSRLERGLQHGRQQRRRQYGEKRHDACHDDAQQRLPPVQGAQALAPQQDEDGRGGHQEASASRKRAGSRTPAAAHPKTRAVPSAVQAPAARAKGVRR